MAINYKQVKVTPTMAKQLLGTNVEFNRNKKMAKVRQFARDMAFGRWQSNTGETIKVTPEGKLIDGQNRLEAVLEAGKTVEMTIAYGVSEGSITVIDTGTARSFADTLKIHQIPNRNNSAAVVRRVVLWERGIKANSSRGSLERFRPTMSEMLDKYKEDAPRFDSAFARAADMKAQKLGRPTPAGTAFYLFSQVDHEAAHQFYDGLISGIGLPDMSPILALRNRLIRATEDNDYVLALYITAWNRYRKDEPMQKMTPSWRGELTDHNFPTPK